MAADATDGPGPARLLRASSRILCDASPQTNAEVRYVDEAGNVVAVERFYDPGLDERSWYADEQRRRGIWRGLHLAYGCGNPSIER